MKELLVVISIVFILISCEDNRHPDMDYDSLKKTTSYNSIDEITSWSIDYYKDNRIIKKENSLGDIYEYAYDNVGNKTSFIYNNHKEVYEYNVNNRINKTLYFTNNELDYYTITQYSNNLIDKTFWYNNNNDTIDWSVFHYNSELEIDSINSRRYDSYYYYSSDVDSILVMSKDKKVMSITYTKYKNGEKIYNEIKGFDFLGLETNAYVKTWEYNEKGLLKRRTEKEFFESKEMSWFDLRMYYNSIDNLFKTEVYDSLNKLTGYSKYFYEDTILIKVERYNDTDNLEAYTIFENS